MLFLESVDYQKTNMLMNLCQIWHKIYDEIDDDVIIKEIREYWLSFVQREALKERIKFDNFSYFLIMKNPQNKIEQKNTKPETIGFIEYFKRENYYSIEEFCVLKEFKNKQNYDFLLKELLKKLDLSFKIYINQNAFEEMRILEDLDFEIKKEELKYLGSNYFIAENVMELKKASE